MNVVVFLVVENLELDAGVLVPALGLVLKVHLDGDLVLKLMLAVARQGD
jgi:hypothetical protein